METGRGADPLRELEIMGKTKAAIPPHIPYQMAPTAWIAWPGQKAETKPIGMARLPKVPTTIPMPVKRANMTI
jgi:hypothetical protein